MTINVLYIYDYARVFCLSHVCARNAWFLLKKTIAQTIYVFSYFTLLFCDICTHHFHQIAKNYH